MADRLLCLQLLLAAAAFGTPTIPAVKYSAGSCSLVPTGGDWFDLRCGTGEPVSFQVSRRGNTLAFSSPGIQEASRQYLKEVAEAARRHAAGAQAHAAEELRKYGYRPAIRQQSLPSPPLEPNGMACLFVPVTAGSRLYLVDLFMLESFCTEYSKAGQPQPVGPEHYVFRSDQEVALATAVPAKEFCAQAWRVQLE